MRADHARRSPLEPLVGAFNSPVAPCEEGRGGGLLSFSALPV